MKRRVVLVMMVVSMAGVACRKADSVLDDARRVQQASQTATPKAQSVNTPREDISPDMRIAVELAVGLYVRKFASRSGFSDVQPPDFSQAFVDRVAKYKHSKCDINASLVTTSLNGSKNTINPKGRIDVSFKGDLNNHFRFSAGEIEVKGGEVYFSDGTVLEIDGKPYVAKNNLWLRR